jgi:hypothetical protein
MKKFILLILMVAASATTRVYDSKQVVIPKYIIKSRGDGTSAVYDSRQIMIPKYVIKGDKVYPSGKPCLPILNKEVTK